MAKGARASTTKANNVKLKSEVFGPVETNRTARLSAKLLELASQPRPKPPVKDVEMDTEDVVAEDEIVSFAETKPSEDMEVDDNMTKTKRDSSKSGKGIIQRRKTSKYKSAIVFPKYADRSKFNAFATHVLPDELSSPQDFQRGKWTLLKLASLQLCVPRISRAGILYDELKSSGKMAFRASTMSLLAANILIPIAILIFASGFFPYKPFLPGLAQYETLKYGSPPEAPFNKLVFMVVDALRSLIRDGGAIPFTAHATSPTITMPRIKAITTGSTPSFLDLILNFAESDTSSTLATQDTWLAQMKIKKTGKMVMPNMIPKQHEMDGIVKLIHEAMTNKEHLHSTLLVLCGDHGMNDAGNHGGSAPGETSPALVFVSPKLKSISPGHGTPAPFKEDFQYYSQVEQSDIAPTLGALLGFPAPKNNIGAVIPELLAFWPKSHDRVQILLRNAKQVMDVVTAAFPRFKEFGTVKDCRALSSEIDELACQWKDITRNQPKNAQENQDVDQWLQATTQWLKKAQNIMTGTASNYDVQKLAIGQAVSTLALILAAAAAYSTLTKSFTESTPILLISLLYGIMMFASSYVEEEQHFWYWATAAWLILLWMKCTRKQNRNRNILTMSSVAIIVVARLSRRWNQTGQKWAGEPDIARSFFSEHRIALWALVGLAYLWTLVSLAARGFCPFPQMASVAIATALVTAALAFKLAFTFEDSPELMGGIAKVMTDSEAGAGASLIDRARIAFIAIGIALAYTIGSGFGHRNHLTQTMRTIHDLLTLFLITQSRVTNIPLILLFEIQFYLLADLDLNLYEITTTSLLLQYSSFFAFGGSNAISSVDLSSAYNGISGYNVLAVGALTFASNWTGPIFWTSATNIMLLRLRATTAGKTGNLLKQHLALLTIIAWSLGQHLGVNVGLGSLLYWLGKMY
ncbi:GPI ethanolamine phosphate transferase [Diplocarpon rosae]|nr:GPI ethanolamine phosphate transferase [Diplocarpon rosae]